MGGWTRWSWWLLSQLRFVAALTQVNDLRKNVGPPEFQTERHPRFECPAIAGYGPTLEEAGN